MYDILIIGESVKPYFINEAIDNAINDYIKSRDKIESVLYNSFLVVVIRMLVNIYGELDIINPYQVKNEESFDNNLMKYGATIEQINEFKRLFDGFYQIDKKNANAIRKEYNPYFIDVQKRLIDLFTLKRINFGLTASDSKDFFDLLYTPGTSNVLRLSYNYLAVDDDDLYEVAEYFKKSYAIKEKVKEEDKKDLFSFDVYRLFNYSIADISKMSNEDINKLNNEIYKAFDISSNALNKDYLLNEKIKALKSQNNPITTGNGYVDILLIMSIIVTTLMVIFIFGTIVI